MPLGFPMLRRLSVMPFTPPTTGVTRPDPDLVEVEVEMEVEMEVEVEVWCGICRNRCTFSSPWTVSPGARWPWWREWKG